MTDRAFPVLWQGDRAYLARLAELDCPRTVPFSLLEPHRVRALRYHDQTLERLAERGGLAPAEIVALTQDLKGPDLLAAWKMTPEQETDLLKAILKIHENST